MPGCRRPTPARPLRAPCGEHLSMVGIVRQDGLYVSAVDGEKVIPKYVVC